MINGHEGSNEVPKVADFLGVSKSHEQQSDLVAFNEIQANDSDYLFHHQNHTSTLVPVQDTVVAAAHGSSATYDFQENSSNLQSLTLTMGSGKGSTTCETSGDNSANTSAVEATPRRTLDTFGQRTSIYRGVTRSEVMSLYYIYMTYLVIVISILNLYYYTCRHRWTGRYEAHLWDNSCRREGQSRKGRQGRRN